MSTLTADSLLPLEAAPGVTPPRVAKAEWIKFRSLRSTWYSLGAVMLVAIGLGVLFADLRGNDVANHGGFASGVDWTQVSLRGTFLAQLAVGVLGVLMITGEYTTGMIRASLSAVPSRGLVLAAKVAVLGVATFVVATITSLIAFTLGQAMLSSHHYGVSLSSPGALRAVIGGGLFLALVALLGLGCGFAIRSTGGALATLFGLLLVLPLLAQALPNSWQNDIDKYLPFQAGSAVLSTVSRPDSLGPWAGIGVLAVYVAVTLSIGFVLLRRRDA
ncbi:MAG TPA: ABC transporter permease subunit [Frankiaceae bacterium]|jgi:ABC-type transport system involved in multi-copper enzyme maturation permease subunit|nr:ABC transporter permease subunit [Frankiaceae bacterium]